MNQTKIYFNPEILSRPPTDPVSYTYEGQEYLVFTWQKSNHLTLHKDMATRLLVPNDNSTFANSIKECVDKEEFFWVFATPAENIKLVSNLDFTKKKGKFTGDCLIIKNTSQVEKLVGTKTKPVEPEPTQITFKVLKQFKETENQWGSYRHILEIEPLALGIEGLPKITQIEFHFPHPDNPTPSGRVRDQGIKTLAESGLYKSSILTEAVGKTFTLKVKKFELGYPNQTSHQTLMLDNERDCVMDSWTEVKEQREPDNNPNNPSLPTRSPEKNNSLQNTWPTKVLITGGILGLLVLTVGTFYYLWKKKKKKR